MPRRKTRQQAKRVAAAASAASDSDEEWKPDFVDAGSSSDFEADEAMSQTISQRQAQRQSQESTSTSQQDDTRAKPPTPKRGKSRRASTSRAPSADDGESSTSPTKKKAATPRKKGAVKTPRKKKETAAERVARLHPEIVSAWDSIESYDPTTTSKDELASQPAQLAVKLLPFQIEGLTWMAHQETKSEFAGGILADEMGMGKTIQTISLLLHRRGSKKEPTLVVCPTVALHQWKSEIQARTHPDSLSVLVYHGQNRQKDPRALKQYDVILTTFSTVESEFRRERYGFSRKKVKTFEDSTLHAIQFHRVILDEAHFIKDRFSNTARAVLDLQGHHKWSLTGTPLQNRVGELYSLVRFLKADPFSYYFCKQCECKSLTWKFSDHRNCDLCGHKSMSHFCWWNREILRPIQNFGPVGKGEEAFNKLKKLLSAIMLRRTKVERGSELGLPPRVVHTRRDLFSHEEEDFYEALFTESKTKFESFVKSGTVLNNYAHIFELLMRMRQSVNHPWLVTHRTDSATDKDTCGICHDQVEDPIKSECKHIFCREEMKLYLDSAVVDSPVCPVCFVPLSIDITQPTLEVSEKQTRKTRPNIVRRLDLERWQSSTKIEALLEELTELQSDSRRIKSIVFSQFTQFLDLLEWRLLRGGVRCVKLDGRMSPAKRAAVIEAFNDRPEVTVFLISLKAGGLALNLTAASRVYIMDPWWNPAAESQAMDRIHRLGQNRPVEVRRLIIENSIESRIDQLQEKKRLLFESTVGMSRSALSRLTEEDLQFLFVL
eukprot:m.66527 g.66527  ORF g.66527 m.66527 type:complete len:775 (-) comp12121_c0_seq1:1020-3344(-)